MAQRFRPGNPIGQAWQDVGRFRVIMTVLIRHGFGELISRMPFQDNFVTRALGHTPPVKDDQSIPKRLSLVFQDLGSTFIKLGQILSTRPDLIPEDYIVEFQKLQTSAAPLDFEEIHKQLTSALSKDPSEIFEWVDEEPLASASIAQVHVARLPNETEVVLKVLRPGVRESLLSDLSILKFLARQLTTLFPDTQLFDPVGIAEEFERALSKEIDFTYEVRNIERFRRNFEDNPDIHIPQVYRALSSNSLLVMERVHGVPVTESSHHRKELAHSLLKAVFEMLFVHSYFHGDLHPGNILVQDDGQIALIDFGLVGRLSRQMRDYTTDLLLGIIRHDYDAVAETLYEIGIKRTAINYNRFQADVATLLDEHLIGAKMEDIEFGVLFQEIVDGAMRHNIAVPPDYTMMFKALITAEGVGKQLDPQMDIFEQVSPYVRRILTQRYGPEALVRHSFQFVGNLSRVLKQFPITARQVLLGIENGKIQFGVDSDQLAQFMHEYRRQGAMKLAVALAGILLLMATFSMDLGTPGSFGIPTFSLLCYGAGGFLAVWVLFQILRDR